MNRPTNVWLVDGDTFVRLADADPSNGSDVDDGLSTRRDEPSLAVISVRGSLNKAASPLAHMMGRATNPDRLRRKVINLRNDGDVDGVMLDIESPGGAYVGMPNLVSAVRDLASEKPTVAFANGKMTSAAYWLGSAADKIVATPSSKIGSLGVFSEAISVADRLEDEGIDRRVIRAGEYKAVPHPAEQLSESAVKVVEKRVNAVYNELVDGIAQNLGMSTEAVKELADGRVYFPTDDGADKLYDEIGTPEEALSLTASMVREQSSSNERNSSMDESDLKENLSTLTKTVESLSEKVDELEDEAGDSASSEDVAKLRAERLLDEHEDKIAADMRDDMLELAVDDYDKAERLLEGMESRNFSGSETPNGTADQNTYSDLETFDDGVGRTEDGELIATTDADVQIFSDLNKDFVDRR